MQPIKTKRRKNPRRMIPDYFLAAHMALLPRDSAMRVANKGKYGGPSPLSPNTILHTYSKPITYSKCITHRT